MPTRVPPAEPPLEAGGDFTVAWKAYIESLTDTGGVAAGVIDGSSAAAGDVGEFLTATAAGVALVTATLKDITSVAVTAGDYEASGVVGFVPNVATPSTNMLVALGSVSATVTEFSQLTIAFPAGAGQRLVTPTVRFNMAAGGTLYLIARATFTISTMAAGGTISVRRVR